MMRESVYRYLIKTRGPLYARLHKATMIPAALIRLLILGVSATIGGVAGTDRERNTHAKSRWKRKMRWAAGLEKLPVSQE